MTAQTRHHDVLSEFLFSLANKHANLSRQSAPPIEQHMSCESDPGYPGRTKVTITGPTREYVQRQIERAMGWVEADGVTGVANFIGPHCHGAGWKARGEVIIHSAPEVTL